MPPLIGLTRRDVLLGIGAIASVANAGAAVSAMPGHDHSKHAPQLPELLDAANNCVDKGQRCITHCRVAFREGKVSLAECASKVHEMQAVCTAFSYLLAVNSKYIKAYATFANRFALTARRHAWSTRSTLSARPVPMPAPIWWIK